MDDIAQAPNGLPAQVEDDASDHILFGARDLLEVFEGVIIAARLRERPQDVEAVKGWIHVHLNTEDNQHVLSLRHWRREAANLQDDPSRSLACLTLGVALFLQESRDTEVPHSVPPATISLIWDLIRDAFIEGSLVIAPERTVHGSLVAPLYGRLNREGRVKELVRLDVWLADGERDRGRITTHFQRARECRWVLAGEGKEHASETREVDGSAAAAATELTRATQAVSGPADAQGKEGFREVFAETYTRDMTYCISANTYRHTEVDPEEIYATLVYVDAPNVPVTNDSDHALGQLDGEEAEDARNPRDVSAKGLIDIVDTLRRFEDFLHEGRRRSGQAEWEPAQRAIRNAIDVCSSPTSPLVNERRYFSIAVAELGYISRRFGHYDRARSILEGLLSDMAKSGARPSVLQAEINGELGVICIFLGLLDEAKSALEAQHTIARELGWERGMCRAIGNLGMVNLRLSQISKDEGLLDEATRQLQDRVEQAKRLKETAASGKAPDWNKLNAWECIGLARLSLCHSARGSVREAIEAARESLQCSFASGDPTVVAMSRFFYGRALMLDGRRNEALAEFNPAEACTPAIALCKEPCEEYRDYLGELVAELGVRFDVVDEQGYSALDYAVFSGDHEAERLVIQGLRRTLPEELVEQHRTEAYLRKGYRELFQEALRPILLENKGHDALRQLRVAYADALAADDSKGALFDRLKYLRYRDFVAFGRLPMSTEGLTQVFDTKEGSGGEANFIVFFSYTWCFNVEAGVPSPDDKERTRYRRMLGAIKAFLELHPSIDPDKLGIWLDYACVDQTSPAAGVNALPLNLAQCNAVISLVDDRYYSRAWCSVEVLIVQTLRKAWGMHSWYICDMQGTISEGPRDLEIEMKGKKLTYEKERPKLVFLERQSKLLG